MDEFRAQMEAFRKDVEEEAKRLKDPYVALDRLTALYEAFDADERVMADQVLSEWALSEDSANRFRALTLVRDLRITQALRSFKSSEGDLHRLPNQVTDMKSS